MPGTAQIVADCVSRATSNMCARPRSTDCSTHKTLLFKEITFFVFRTGAAKEGDTRCIEIEEHSGQRFAS